VLRGGHLLIQGKFGGAPGRTLRLEFFADTLPDPSNHGEARVFLGFVTVRSGQNGKASFTAVFGVAGVAAGNVVTAAATDLQAGDTSEFALDVAVS
jgi:hypothetical protein